MRLSIRGGWMVALAVAAALLSPLAPAASDPGSPVTPSPAFPSDSVPVGEQDELFPATLDGPDAAAKLTPPQLEMVAKRAETDVASIKQVLDDPTSRVSPEGLLFHVEHAPARPATRASIGVAPSTSETFALHSKPGTGRVIFLDFGGSSANEHGWDAVPAGRPPFSMDNDPAFNEAERALIGEVWARVAEDFAPFDVDVTTEDPGAAGLVRSSPSDDGYGVRMLITQDQPARRSICGTFRCAGVAHLGVFSSGGGETTAQPLLDGWVFADMNWFDPLLLTETISHEVGHTFGLGHDGTTSSEYFSGHGNWVPIMGATTRLQISQWSAGEYAGANNREDDLAIIAADAPFVADDHGDTPATATQLGQRREFRTSGTISTRADKDVIGVDRSTCDGTMAIKVTPAAQGPNLDIRVQVRDGDSLPHGPPAAPPSSLSGPLSGMGVDFALDVAAGVYFIEIDGVGAHNPRTNGYSDYGSVGEWNLEVSGCANAAETLATPGQPRASRAVLDQADMSLTVRWAPPQSDGGTAITGHVIQLQDRAPVHVPAPATSYTFAAVPEDTEMVVQVSARNSVGEGEPLVLRQPGFKQWSSAPRGLVITPGDEGTGIVSFSWEPPEHLRHELRYYCFELGSPCQPTLGTTRQVRGLAPGHPHTVTIRAFTAAGGGVGLTRTFIVPRTLVAPGHARRIRISNTTSSSLTVGWDRPAGTEPQPDSYRVVLNGRTVATVSGRLNRHRFTGLKPGTTYRVAVIAVRSGLNSLAVGLRKATFTAPPTATPTGRATSGTKGGAITATARWGEPHARGGLAITSYRITAYRLDSRNRALSRATFTAKPSARRLMMRLPQKGRYRFTVVAVNRKGPSKRSTYSRIVTAQ